MVGGTRISRENKNKTRQIENGRPIKTKVKGGSLCPAIIAQTPFGQGDFRVIKLHILSGRFTTVSFFFSLFLFFCCFVVVVGGSVGCTTS